MRDKIFYDEEYVRKERSPTDIAQSEGTYSNKIRRELKALGYELRSKSEAQILALKSGRHKHPTKGTKRSIEVKTRISEGMATAWENTPAAERERRSNLAQQQWQATSEDDRVLFRKLASDGVRKASREGSKLEHFLLTQLHENNYEADAHMEFLFDTEKMHADLYIPALRTIIEVDGPTHSLPIWGEEILHKNQKTDQHKNMTMTTRGYNVVRIDHVVKTLSESYKRKLWQKLLVELERIEKEGVVGEVIKFDPSQA